MTREWYFQMMGQDIGPLSAAELKSKVSTGQIQPDTLVRKGADGKWIFGGNVKGLFPEPPKSAPAPVAPPPPAPNKPVKSIDPVVPKGIPLATDPTASTSTPTSTSSSFPTSVPVASFAESEADGPSALLEFYDFVGFREAISPPLYDAIKQFAADRGITLAQLNRRALAGFIQSPALGSDLLITSLTPMPAGETNSENQSGGYPVSGRDVSQVTTFRVALSNCGDETIRIRDALFVPKNIDVRSYDSPPVEQTPNHTGLVSVRLRPLNVGKPIRMKLEVTLPPRSEKEIVLWFYGNSDEALVDIFGQLVVGRGDEMAMSDFFTISAACEIPG